MSQSNNAPQKIGTIDDKFMHDFNPLHFYSRIVEYGIKRDDALEIARFYEEYIYTPIKEIKKNYNRINSDDRTKSSTQTI